MKTMKYLIFVTLLLSATIIDRASGGFLDFLFGRRKPGQGSSGSDADCSKPADPGPCRGAFEMWYWDKPAEICNVFVYGGCAGNGNRFESFKECNKKCNKGSGDSKIDLF